MKILYLTHFFPPELNGGARRVDDLSTLWASLGVNVTVVTGFPSHPTGIVPAEYRGMWTADEVRHGVRVVRTKKYNAPNRGFAQRVLNHLSLAVSATLVAVRKRLAPDVVICTSPPLLIGLSGLLLTRVLRVPLVFEVRDLWPDQAIQLGMLRNPLLVRLARALEEACYRRASRVVVVTHAARTQLLERGIPPEKVVVVRNGVTLTHDAPAPPPVELRTAPGQFVVSYFGTMGMSQGLSVFFDAAEALAAKGRRDIRIVLMGDGVDREALTAEARKRDVPNVAILPPCSFEEVPSYYQATDVSAVCLRDLPLFRDTIPSKVFEIMAAGVPVLGVIAGETCDIIEEAGCGVCAPPENAAALVAAIERLYAASTEERRRMGAAGRRWVEENCSRERQAEEYLEVLGELVPSWRGVRAAPRLPALR